LPRSVFWGLRYFLINDQITYLHANVFRLYAACNVKRKEIAYLNFGVQALEALCIAN
jgi:hypothetical protein